MLKTINPYFNSKIILIISLLVLISLTSLSTSNAASQLYVNGDDGDDIWDGTTPTYTTGTTGPMKTIQKAIDSVENNGIVNVADGTYKEHLEINKNVSLKGESKEKTIIDGTNSGRPFYINSTTIVTINNFTIKNGQKRYGGGILNLGTLTINNCDIKENSATATDIGDDTYASANSYGGGILNQGTLTIKNSQIQYNTATTTSIATGQNSYAYAGVYGGGIYNAGTLNITNSQIQYNTATGTSIATGENAYAGVSDYGGGIYNDGTLAIINSQIENNHAIATATYTGEGSSGYPHANGGGISNWNTLTIKNSQIQYNTATSKSSSFAYANGGGISNWGGILKIYESTLRNNSAIANGAEAYSYGGAIINIISLKGEEKTIETDDTIYIIGCNILNNAAREGGAIYNVNDNVVANFNRIIGNTPNAIVNIPPKNSASNFDARYNWWGSNNPNFTSLINGSGVDYNPWLIMKFTATPTVITQGGTSTLTADFRYDSNGIFHDPSYGHLPDGTPVTFTTSLGEVGSSSVVKYTINGVAIGTLRATESGTGIITSRIDDQILSTNIIINSTPTPTPDPAPTVHGQTVPMQRTGLPVGLLAIAILMVLGGIVSTKK
ncbi:MAG: hypothetical protein Q8M06_06250 [Methanobacteriaceae archaeon]|nr:hypothetical protein [Methanobacteriaceae archaeon]